ncbi:hypothetical protein FGB62_15g04 [Gracilaria domingensis]|nr:hypothetical protein FGB62_15g04 [Gracilaria domingensis]
MCQNLKAEDLVGLDSRVAEIKRARDPVSHENELEESCQENDFNTAEEVLLGPKIFKPLFLLSVWTDTKSLRKKLNVAVTLPSGIGKSSFGVYVVDGGEYLEISVSWPEPLLDIELLHKTFLEDPNDNFQMDHPKVSRFCNALKYLRKHQSEKVHSVARIPLPFQVQTHIDSQDNLAWIDDTTRVVYVEFTEARSDDYPKVHNTQDFRAS